MSLALLPNEGSSASVAVTWNTVVPARRHVGAQVSWLGGAGRQAVPLDEGIKELG